MSAMCALCDTRLAAVAVCAMSATSVYVRADHWRDWSENARCLECALDDLTRVALGKVPTSAPSPDPTRKDRDERAHPLRLRLAR
ncbi:MAG: hypothetical protein ACXVX9_15220 [Mycobacteriaceae bacterium]